jgi:hypothetical protein
MIEAMDAKDDKDLERMQKVLNTRDKINYFAGVLNGIEQMMDNRDDDDWVNYFWYYVSNNLADARNDGKKLGMKVSDNDDQEHTASEDF